MHKDCIILCHEKNAQGNLLCLQEINGKPFINYVAAYLRKFHICKVIFSISSQKEAFKKHILDNREVFSFAFDFAEQKKDLGSGGGIMSSLKYSDTPDVLIMYGHQYFDVNIDDLIAWQQTKMGDATIALSYQKNTENQLLAHLDENNFAKTFSQGEASKSGLAIGGLYCIFRPSFLNINFPESFSFEDDYLKKYKDERDFIGMIADGVYFNPDYANTNANQEDFISSLNTEIQE